MGQKWPRVDELPRGRERPRGGVYYISDSDTVKNGVSRALPDRRPAGTVAGRRATD